VTKHKQIAVGAAILAGVALVGWFIYPVFTVLTLMLLTLATGYGAWWRRVVHTDGAAAVTRSAERYLRFALGEAGPG